MTITRTNTLKLRRQSIRTLTPSELRVAHGGVHSSPSTRTIGRYQTQ